ncbi:MAG: CvpA family protein [Candidatus Nanopelagicaceae bacterium]|nr:CvpA family protein [Candidatus Nanopelagicaceae bacterium]
MFVDAVLIILAILGVITGFRRGFLHTVFSTVGYIGGGVLGLALALQFAAEVHSALNRFGATVLAIFIMAELGRRLLGALAKFFRARLLWSPLRFIDSLAGVVLELLRVTVISYLVISVILWSPWSAARSAVLESTIYPKINEKMPAFVTHLRTEIEKNLNAIPRL